MDLTQEEKKDAFATMATCHRLEDHARALGARGFRIEHSAGHYWLVDHKPWPLTTWRRLGLTEYVASVTLDNILSIG